MIRQFVAADEPPPQMAPASPGRERERSPLSQREREIVALVAQGFKNKEMAEKMFISEQTVKNHLHNIFDKLGVSDAGTGALRHPQQPAHRKVAFRFSARGRVVFTLVRRARQRLLYNELLSQGANASSAALIAFILLLLLGTQVLNWQWALAIPLVAAGAGLYVARRRLPSPYTVAQMVDHRCALADTLSTALFFSQAEPPSHVSREVRQSQFEQAGRLSQTVDVRRAVPYTVPRAVYPLAALLLAASGLFALRYGLSRRLDLKPPLARILQQKFGGNEPAKQARDVRPKAPENPDSRDDGTAPFSDPDRQPDVSSDPIQDTGAAATPNQRLR